MTVTFWTPRRDAKLREMWDTHTAIEIALELGTTPNAVIGRIHRIMGSHQEKIAKQLAAAPGGHAQETKTTRNAATRHPGDDAEAHRRRDGPGQSYCAGPC